MHLMNWNLMLVVISSAFVIGCWSDFLRSLTKKTLRMKDIRKYAEMERDEHFEFEERKCYTATWISMSTLSASDFDDVYNSMYPKLLRYFNKENYKGMEINSTTKYRIRVLPCQGLWGSKFTMSMEVDPYVTNRKRGGGAPRPMDKDLVLEEEKYSLCYVRTFDVRNGAKPTDFEWRYNAHKLAIALEADPDVERDFYDIVWYRGPDNKQVNEVIIKKTTSEWDTIGR